MSYPEEIVSVSGTAFPGGRYGYITVRADGQRKSMLISRWRYRWFHQWRTSTASGEMKIVHYFSTKQRAAPVPAWVPGRAERLEPICIVYV